MEDERIEEQEEMRCVVCETELDETTVVRNQRAIYCKQCWNEKVLKDRKVLPPYAFLITFILFQIFFYMPAMMHDTRGWSSPLHFILCGVIGLLCGMLAFEIVYRRLTNKLIRKNQTQPENH
jgi:nitrate reductase gamma subunit